MSRYQPLADLLAKKKANAWEASFAEIESELGFKLPPSAHRYPAWWANQTGAGHSQTKGWRSVGWRTCAVDLERKKVRFVRDRDPMAASALRRDRATLLRRAAELTGISDPDELVDEALRTLIARE